MPESQYTPKDTRFDCLQALQIERSGSTYTFYMNDKLLYTLQNSALTGGTIGYVTKNTPASFGFIGATGAVGGYGAADQFTTVTDKAGFIPAYQAKEAPDCTVLDQGVRVVPLSLDNTLSYRISAAAGSKYDLSVLCHKAESNTASIEVYVDGQSVGAYTLSFSEDATHTAVIRDIPLSKGLHAIAGVNDGEYFEVEAWFLSHAHKDHMYELSKMLSEYSADSNYKINNIYFDFPEFGSAEYPANN